MSDESAKSRSSRLKTKALLFLCLFLASAGVFFGYLQDYASTPTGSSEEAKFVEIKPGMTLRQVAHFLNREQLLSSPGTFMVYTYAHGKQNDIRAGEYQFSPSMAPRKILDYLTQGQTILYTVTI
ncbi:MAG: aminodeoxychorismate lyase, partial [Nitrospinaceae bacterium]|nr:endolytic transglycosylase MltG [Nitrospinaceae bacterium]NIU44323.1 endolytic transglycosylase MltG [Nitrospinaceae bacterium]NIY15270.1 aminodeoxychorismate lyase [Nitrospinaceae bacterium]